MIVLSGLPGKFAATIARNESCDLAPVAVSSPRNDGQVFESTHGRQVVLRADKSDIVSELFSQRARILVALELSPAVAAHLDIWHELQIPLVIGSTAYDSTAVRKEIERREMLAVIAPNFAAPLVALQQILKDAAQQYPGVFEGFSLGITESHQAAKKDKSGTARAMLPSLSALGFAPATEASIQSVRDVDRQRAMGVPPEHIDGHAWHRYEATSGDIQIALEHRTNGRQMYVDGALKACRFAAEQWNRGTRGKVFTMLDVAQWQS